MENPVLGSTLWVGLLDDKGEELSYPGYERIAVARKNNRNNNSSNEEFECKGARAHPRPQSRRRQ